MKNTSSKVFEVQIRVGGGKDWLTVFAGPDKIDATRRFDQIILAVDAGLAAVQIVCIHRMVTVETVVLDQR